MKETPFFFQLREERLYAVLHRSRSGPARRGVVLCHALGEEKLWSHRVYVNLARDLALAGISVLRFDFRGEGESDRDFEQCDLGTRAEDALRATQVLLELEPSLRSAILVGHRLGAAAAAEAAVQAGPCVEALIAWDPIVDGHQYLMQLLRSVMASRLAIAGVAPTRTALLRALEGGQTVVVDGYGITPAFFRELGELKWPERLAAVPCRKLVIDGACEPAFWRESKTLQRRAPAMTARSLAWMEASL